MKIQKQELKNSITEYLKKINMCFDESLLNSVEIMANKILEAWKAKKRIYICGNGGSSANAQHIANDYIYGIGASAEGNDTPGIDIQALTSNSNIITCLANDTGYENIFSTQLEVKGKEEDLLIVLSGSGNSQNIINALKKAKKKKIKSIAILGFNGGKCKELADITLHIHSDDMEVCEDVQMIIFNICKKLLNSKKSFLYN